MSQRKIITDHCLLRWLERVEGHDIPTYRRAADRSGYNGESDGDVVDFLQHYTDVPVSAIRRELMDVVSPALLMRATTLKYKGVTIKLRSGGAITCYPRRARRSRSYDGRRPAA